MNVLTLYLIPGAMYALKLFSRGGGGITINLLKKVDISQFIDPFPAFIVLMFFLLTG